MTTPAQEKARAKAQEKEIRRQFDVFAGEHVDRLPEWAWIGYYFGYQASLSSPAVVALVEALRKSNEALEAIAGEMTVGDRFTNAGQFLLDAIPMCTAALAPFTTGAGEKA